MLKRESGTMTIMTRKNKKTSNMKRNNLKYMIREKKSWGNRFGKINLNTDESDKGKYEKDKSENYELEKDNFEK